MLNSTLLFVHVPKTAGTSFREAATEYFGANRCLHDYGPKASETSALVRQMVYGAGDLHAFGAACHAAAPSMLAGHFPVSKFSGLVSACNLVTFVREPWAQTCSHYFHQRRDNGYEGTLDAFMRGATGAALMPRLLAGLPLEAWGFLGVTERYEESLALFNELFSVSLPNRLLNQRRVIEGAAADTPEPSLIEHAAAFDRLAMDARRLYQRANALLDARLAMRAKGLPFTHGAIQSVAAAHLRGFAFQRGLETPIEVELLRQGVPVASTFAKDDRPGLRALNAPRSGYLGFEFKRPFQRGSEAVEWCVRVAQTGQLLWRQRPEA